jgi:hypothetical protein
MSEAANFAKAGQDNAEGSRKTATTLTPSTSFGDIALGFTSLDDVAVWLNEGGAGGEVIR